MKLSLFFNILFNVKFIVYGIRCFSFMGLETELYNSDCSWEQPLEFYMNELGKRGFDYVRIPFSGKYIEIGDFSVMDHFFYSAKLNNMSIILDWHRNMNSGWQGDWLDDLNIEKYFQLYYKLLDRYYMKPELQVVSLFNEYKGMNFPYWKEQMEYVVLKMEEKYPNRFYWLIGCPQWSGNCRQMDWSNLPFYDRIRLDIHKYEFSRGPNQEQYEDDWNFSFPKDRNKTIVGEWGFLSDKPEQVEWAKRFVNWLKQENITDACFWIGGVSSSGDTGGLWKDCKVFDEMKFDIVKSLWDKDHRHLQYGCHKKGLWQCIRNEHCCWHLGDGCLQCYKNNYFLRNNNNGT